MTFVSSSKNSYCDLILLQLQTMLGFPHVFFFSEKKANAFLVFIHGIDMPIYIGIVLF